MRIEKIRENVIEYSLKMLDEKLTTGTGGNISIREGDIFAITPSGVDYKKLTSDMISVVDMDGRLLEGKKPSSELEIHRLIYKNKKFKAIMHTHSPYVMAFSTLGMDLPAITYLIGDFNAKKIRCAPYETFGTKELAKKVLDYMEDSKAVIMANHGATTAGENIEEAFKLAKRLEEISKLYIIAKSAGTPNIISDENMDIVLEKFKTYGQ